MLSFFSGVIKEDILLRSMKDMENVDKSTLRSLRSNLRRNDELRDRVNTGKISVASVLSMNHEEIADDDTRKRREKYRDEALKESILKIEKMNKIDFDILINKVEDP